jgi:hypothetical protein
MLIKKLDKAVYMVNPILPRGLPHMLRNDQKIINNELLKSVCAGYRWGLMCQLFLGLSHGQGEKTLPTIKVVVK